MDWTPINSDTCNANCDEIHTKIVICRSRCRWRHVFWTARLHATEVWRGSVVNRDTLWQRKWKSLICCLWVYLQILHPLEMCINLHCRHLFDLENPKKNKIKKSSAHRNQSQRTDIMKKWAKFARKYSREALQMMRRWFTWIQDENSIGALWARVSHAHIPVLQNHVPFPILNTHAHTHRHWQSVSITSSTLAVFSIRLYILPSLGPDVDALAAFHSFLSSKFGLCFLVTLMC